MLIELLKELLVQIATVCHLGCWIQKCHLGELPGSLSYSSLPRVVIEDLDRTDNFTVFGADRKDTNFHGNPVATLVVKVNFRPMRMPIRYGKADRAVSPTEQAPGVVDMHQEVVSAVFPYNFLDAVSGKVFRCVVPVRNPAFPISEVDTIEKVIQHLFEETVRFI